MNGLIEDLRAVSDLVLLQDPAELQRFSRGAYDYSPVLKAQLDRCQADLVVRPSSVAAVEALAAACYRHRVPLTLRGTGTGNYGQSVPLEGGVVMLTTALQRVRSIDPHTGVVTVEPGCSLRELDQQLRLQGRQLRLLPSTCLLYTSPSPRDGLLSRMPSSA